ncbi:NAD(P)/FAD-dependent oxidoreductase [Thioalkalivibrio paradoxus]|uniref:Halogenase n=1 Tax=Thioalkalivibrio paradoxus ARh 1 TaxID=713585 RepID=W0DK40_9GAMM|nr:FAD-dependent monooxygenase [Thioalkalivibrio paradoxus]AHE97607.1 halogenase [Thioalkalivibrio paradoxus ARh 1]
MNEAVSRTRSAIEVHEVASEWDVVVCGAGVAGLTFALQLRQRLPGVSIAVVDRLERPLPRAAFKVGEATTEAGAWYLTEVIGIGDYLEQRHVRKLGLRMYFQGDTPGHSLDARPEIGVSRFLTPYAYSVDRGRLENDLRGLLEERAIHLIEGGNVADFQLAADDGAWHEIRIESKTGMRRLHARWLVDGSGRRALLRRRMGLTQHNPGYGSVWFRVATEIDVEDWVAPESESWHSRAGNGARRYHATCHLVGPGYWVWLIALPGGYTSIGIVSNGKDHPYTSFNTPDKCMGWIERNEPLLAAALQGHELCDFAKMPNYSYVTRQAFSASRWACIGEAAAFPDPLYGTGFEVIALSNSMTVNFIEKDFRGTPCAREIDAANRFFTQYCLGLTDAIQSSYDYFGHPVIATLKVLWDTLAGWLFNAPLLTHALYDDPEMRLRLRAETGRFYFLSRRLRRLMNEWSRAQTQMVRLEYLDFTRLPFFRAARQAGFRKEMDAATLLAHHRDSLALMERFTLVIFLLALADCRPGLLARVPDDLRLNAWAVGLDPGRWEVDGLLARDNPRHDLDDMLRPLLSMIRAPVLDRFLESEVVGG